MVRSMMAQENLPISYWGDALLTTAFILNRVPSTLVTSTPYELWTKCKQDLSILRPWGSAAYIHDNSRKYGKLGPRGKKCIFIRYGKEEANGFMEAGILRSGIFSRSLNEYLLISWNPPNEHWTKLNVDGSFWTHSNSVSCGGVFRDSNGIWFRGFTRKMGRGDSLLAEDWAIKTGLDISWGLGIKKIIIEADSLSIINMIEKGLDDSHPLSAIINDIRGIAASDWEVEFVHSLRESNKVANALTNWAHTLPATRAPNSRKHVEPEDH
ncbi:ribonuclease H [Senna tora]|uniref:Ribonuclease H n=1 Tax=Senna tora TaxID=362788 RepID=A0A834SG09_9FABA|nr:ribonuclease H [Senna tora]